MKKGQNFNRPAPGSRIAVEPIRKIRDIKTIMKILENNPRNHLLFTIGINNGLRMGDILKLRVKDVEHLGIGDILNIKEQKTGKENILVINKPVHASLQNYLDAVQPDEDAWLFPSRKGDRPITIPRANNLVKEWARVINLKGNYGAHSLRKTWGYIQRVEYGVGFDVICKRYKHVSPVTTMRYLGIEDREVRDILMNEVG